MNVAALHAVEPPQPARRNTDETAPRVEYLTFVTHGRRFAAPITEVREIRNWSTPTSLPHAPAYLLGVVNLRGTVLPVVDLSLRLGIGPTPSGARNVFVVVEVDGRPLGLLVEAVADIVVPAPDDHQPLPDTGGGEAGGLVEGLILSPDGMVQILQLSALAILRPDVGEAGHRAAAEDRAC